MNNNNNNKKERTMSASKKQRINKVLLPMAPKCRRTPRILPSIPMRMANHVCTARMQYRGRPDFKFDRLMMVDALMGFYSEKGFACVTVKYSNPSACCHISRNGSMVVCGVEVELHAIQVMYRILRRLHSLYGWDLVLSNYTIHNTVMSMALGRQLNLAEMARHFGIVCNYDPVYFPGLQYYPQHPERKPCVILYESGAVVLVGITGGNLLQQGMDIISKTECLLYFLSLSLSLSLYLFFFLFFLLVCGEGGEGKGNERGINKSNVYILNGGV